MQTRAAQRPRRTAGSAEPDGPAERALSRRAVEAAIWGMPMVSVEAMRQAFFGDAGAEYNDILYFSKPADWRFQTATPNASSLYVYFNVNLRDGPVVLELPAAVGAGLFGTVLDAWQVPLADVGPDGEDHGKGGRYLLTPPGYAEKIAGDFIPVPSQTFNGYGLFRAIPASSSLQDREKAVALVKQIRLYPLADDEAPPPQRYIDIAGKLFDGVVRYDDSFFDSLARMVAEEPVQTRDLLAMTQLQSIGIEKGKLFKPDPPMRRRLRDAAAEAHAGFVQMALSVEPYWPNAHWGLHSDFAPKTRFSFLSPDRYGIDERAMTYFFAYAPPANLGAATFYLSGMQDADGEDLLGSNAYRLRVPPNPPVNQYWAVTAYDLETAAFVRKSPRLTIDSYQEKVARNEDGSIDVYFGPKPPAGKEANWIATAPGRPWFSLFRFYGPQQALFDKTWALPDFEKIG